MTLTPPGRIMINISNILYLGEFFHSEKRSHEEQSEGWGKGISRAWLWVQIQFGLIQIRPKSLLSIIFGLGLFFPLVPLFCHCLSFLSPACPEGERLLATRGAATVLPHLHTMVAQIMWTVWATKSYYSCALQSYLQEVMWACENVSLTCPPMYVVCIVSFSAQMVSVPTRFAGLQ